MRSFEAGARTTNSFDFDLGHSGGKECGCVDFGSGPALSMAAGSEWGMPVFSELAQDSGCLYPGFCGGAGHHETTVVTASEDEDMQPSRDANPRGPMSSLDFVMQNLQCRLGNPRNRCYANSAFRLWAWAGSFMGGARLWNQTGTFVDAIQ